MLCVLISEYSGEFEEGPPSDAWKPLWASMQIHSSILFPLYTTDQVILPRQCRRFSYIPLFFYRRKRMVEHRRKSALEPLLSYHTPVNEV